MVELPEEQTLVGRLRHLARERPDHRYVTWLDGKGKESICVTYQKLWCDAVAVAELLVQKGVQPGDRVMVSYPPGPQFLAGLFGTMLAGAIPCSVYPPNALPRSSKIAKQHSFDQFNTQTQDAGAKFAVTTQAYQRLLRATALSSSLYRTPNLTWLATDTLSKRSSARAPTLGPELSQRKLHTLALIQYSSGSTSAPKGVMIPHTSLDANLQAIKAHSFPSDTPENLKMIGWLPQYHDYGLVGGYFSFAYTPQAEIVAFSPVDFIRNPLLWADILDRYANVPTMTCGPDFSYALLAKRMQQAGRVLVRPGKHNNTAAGSEEGAGMKSLLLRASMGGESVAESTLEGMKAIGIPAESINPHYGMAECCLYVSSVLGDEEIRAVDGVVSTGNIDQCRQSDLWFRIVDPTTRECVPDGQEGEIMVWSTSLSSGYWGKPELSQQTFAAMTMEGKKYMATGDIGKICDGQLYVCGRLKELIIVNGKNLYPTDLERSINNTFGAIVRPGCTVAYQKSPTEAGVIVEIRSSAIADGSSEQLSLEAIRSLIQGAHNVTVGRIDVLKQGTVPKTTSGKLRRVEAKRLSLAGEWSKKATLSTWEGAAFRTRSSRNVISSRQSHVFNVLGDFFDDVFDPDSTWKELRLSATDSEHLRDSLSEKFKVALPPDFQEEYPTPSSLCRRLSLEKGWENELEISQLSPSERSQVFIKIDEHANDQDTASEDPMVLIKAIVGTQLQADQTWETNGLTSLQHAELVSAVAEHMRVNLNVDFDVQYPTPALLSDHIASSKGAQFPCRIPELPVESQRKRVNWLAALQFIGISVLLLLFALSLVPPYVAGKLFSDMALTFEVGSTGRYVTWFWFPVILPTFALTLSLQVIVVKWLVIGRYKSRAVELPSLGYVRWWFVDQLVQMWELWVGQFLIDTIFLVAFYRMLGAKVGLSVKLTSFLREFDLISIDERSAIEHQIRCRNFHYGENRDDAHRLCFRPIRIGKECQINGMVSPGAKIGDGSRIANLAAVREGAQIPNRVVAQGAPAFQAGRAQKVPRTSCLRMVVFETMKVLWLIAELYLFYACFLVSQILLKERLPADWRYSPLVYWVFLLALVQVFALLCSVALKWLLIGKRKADHEETPYRRFVYWACDLHFHLAVYLLWATPVHNSRIWNVILILHGLDVDLRTFFVDVLPVVPSKVDFLRIRESFFSAAVAIDVRGPLEIVECNVGYGVRFEVLPNRPVSVRRCVLPPRSVIGSSLDGESGDARSSRRSGISALYATCKEVCHVLLLGFLPATLMPAFEFLRAFLRGTEQTILASFGLVFAATLIQYIMWILAIRGVQTIFVRKNAAGELYTCHISFIWALRTFSCAWVLQGTPFFGYLARFLGSQVDGELWCFGCSFYDFKMLHFADRVIVDYDCHITGHYTVFDQLVIDDTWIGGIVHPGCYAHGGATIASGGDQCQQHGPWKHFLQSCKQSKGKVLRCDPPEPSTTSLRADILDLEDPESAYS